MGCDRVTIGVEGSELIVRHAVRGEFGFFASRAVARGGRQLPEEVDGCHGWGGMVFSPAEFGRGLPNLVEMLPKMVGGC